MISIQSYKGGDGQKGAKRSLGVVLELIWADYGQERFDALDRARGVAQLRCSPCRRPASQLVESVLGVAPEGACFCRLVALERCDLAVSTEHVRDRGQRNAGQVPGGIEPAGPCPIDDSQETTCVRGNEDVNGVDVAVAETLAHRCECRGRQSVKDGLEVIGLCHREASGVDEVIEPGPGVHIRRLIERPQPIQRGMLCHMLMNHGQVAAEFPPGVGGGPGGETSGAQWQAGDAFEERIGPGQQPRGVIEGEETRGADARLAHDRSDRHVDLQRSLRLRVGVGHLEDGIRAERIDTARRTDPRLDSVALDREAVFPGNGTQLTG